MTEPGNIKQHVDELVADLKQEYGELRVKAGLAKLEARDKLQNLESKLGKLEAKAKELGTATAEASKDIGAAAKLLGEEIRDGLKDVAKHV